VSEQEKFREYERLKLWAREWARDNNEYERIMQAVTELLGI